MHANFAIRTYSLSYSAGVGGSISGQASQTVNHGENGSAVTAVPSSGWRFLKWSDDSTQNPRTDTNVMSSLSAVANFARISPEDFDGDSKSDTICESPLENGFIYFMDGVIPSAPASAYIYQARNANRKIVASCDFNGDGKADILWEDSIEGVGCVYLMNGQLFPTTKTSTISRMSILAQNGMLSNCSTSTEMGNPTCSGKMPGQRRLLHI